jgi:hypothetical protein
MNNATHFFNQLLSLVVRLWPKVNTRSQVQLARR